MAIKNPLLFVTNPRAIRQAKVIRPGNSTTDFYAEHDAQYKEHKAVVLESLAAVDRALSEQGQFFGESGYVKVRLKERAWAKSHRPTKRLFTPDVAPVIGAVDIGEILVRVDRAAIRHVTQGVADSEVQSRPQKFDKTAGKFKPDPTRARSETGAMEEISLWSSNERNVPVVDEAIEFFQGSDVAAVYTVELFEPLELSSSTQRNPSFKTTQAGRMPTETFLAGLEALGRKLSLYMVPQSSSMGSVVVQIGLVDGSPGLAIFGEEGTFEKSADTLRETADYSVDAHSMLLRFLERHPLVRRVSVPQFFTSEYAKGFTGADMSSPVNRIFALKKFALPLPDPDVTYPRIGIIDGGVSSEFDDWILSRHEPIPEHHRSLAHGSAIAGLLVAGQALNPRHEAQLEDDGCLLVDIAMQPDKNACRPGTYYPSGTRQFLLDLEATVRQVKEEHGVRVFNFSLNTEKEVASSAFSEQAKGLDEIARRLDVIFVISAGNAIGAKMRAEWSSKPTLARDEVLRARDDRLFCPAESVANISVGALNPPEVKGALAHVPARYSRRGPGVRGLVKPDVAHYGGAFTDLGVSGLRSVSADLLAKDIMGTSFAAPLVAKTLATLDVALGGKAPREVLMAMLLHSARLRVPLSRRSLLEVARQTVGFGTTASATDILELDPYTFGVVISDSLQFRGNTIIDFKWPQSLVDAEGGCSGDARVTLVYSPPIDFRFEAEAAQANIQVSLRQANPTGKGDAEEFDDEDSPASGKTVPYNSKLKPVHSKGVSKRAREAKLTLDNLKWSPTKILEGALKSVGTSSDWRLTVDYLVRDQAVFPEEGIPFAVVLTISDPEKRAPVYDEMRQELNSLNVRVDDIRNVLTVRV